ncbi:MAG: Gfo/Idh/MocA family oxidoreductase [Planctomycetes bacterium]|nr:Gfo/Idh/MocA family oxidoreductase [Planctomycetota bacterium]
MPTRYNRRKFLQQSTEAGAVLAAASALGGVHAYAAEKPSTVRLGIIGCGSIMNHHMKGLVSRGDDVSIAWLCDVDPRQIDNVAQSMSGFQSTPPKRTQRHEDVLEDSNVDACVIATPHHWHAPIALRAMQAGKDVYVEKPISHVYNEGHLMIAAAKKYGRIVQQGSQMRSSPVTKKAGQLLKEGIIGEVKVARAWTAEARSLVKPVPDADVPKGVDYDRWLGPAPARPFNPHRFHLTWRMYRDYANGEIGDDGIHDLDMATWGLGVDTLPKQITARGGRMLLHGHASDYPDNMNVTYEYPDGRLIVYENYPFTAYGMYGFDNGNVFYGTEGYMVFSRRGAFSVFLGPKQKPGPTEGKELRGQRGYGEHMADFLTAVRERTSVSAPPETAHRSCALVHLGDIAYRVQGQLNFDPSTEQFAECEQANQLLEKKYRQPFGLPEGG